MVSINEARRRLGLPPRDGFDELKTAVATTPANENDTPP